MGGGGKGVEARGGGGEELGEGEGFEMNDSLATLKCMSVPLK